MRLVTALLLLFLIQAPLAAAELRVVATFSILADMTRQVAGDHADVRALVGPDTDSHTFEPTPAHARRVAEADLVVRNGLKLEGWTDRLLDAADGSAMLVTATEGISPIRHHGHSHGHGHNHHHDHGDRDPHAWLDLDHAMTYVRNIRDGLKAVDPERAHHYAERAGAYLEQLQELDERVRELLDPIPRDQRRVLTSHAAFGYFEAAYGVEFLAPRGLSTEAEPSAADVAELIRAVRQQRVTALLPDNLTDARLLRRIAEEGEMSVGPTIYSDALSDAAGPAPTYLAMMEHNARVIAGALTRETD